MDTISEQKLTRLISNIDTLLADIGQHIDLASMGGQTPQDVLRTNGDRDVLDRSEDSLSEGPEDDLLTSNPEYSGGSPLDRFDERSSIWTERQHSLIWYYESFGVIGLAYIVKEIARAEILEESGMEPMTPKLYRKRFTPSKRRHRFGDIEVEDSQETEEEEEVEGFNQSHTLADELESLVNARGPDDKSWRRIYYDWFRGGQSRVLFYLSALPDELTQAILHGDLPNRMSQPSFARQYEASVKLSQNPGIYTLYIARTRASHSRQGTAPMPSPEENLEALGLTLEETMVLCEAATRYIDVDDTEYVECARIIDSAVGKFQDRIDYSFQRRYGASGDRNDFASHRAFVKNLTSGLADWISVLQSVGQENILKIPLRRCLAHVGMASNPLSRCPVHWTHGSVPSPIFAMVTAILQALWPDRFNVAEHSYQVFRVVRFEELAFAEILSSIISSAYYWDLGLSHTYAGTGGQANRDSEQYKSRLVENAQCIWNERVQIEQVRASVAKLEKMSNVYRQDMHERRRDVRLLEDSIARGYVSLQKKKEALETARLALQVRALQGVLCNELRTDWGQF